MSYNTVLGSQFEFSLRILTLLNELDSVAIDADTICIIDHMAIYAADYDLAKTNLHGDNPYRASEYAVRKRRLNQAVNQLIIDRLVEMETRIDGVSYKITSLGKLTYSKLKNSYSNKYTRNIKLINESYSPFSFPMLMKLFREKSMILGGENE